jgi:hypothetical protein
MSTDEYKVFVEAVERNGGRIVLYATFPTDTQKHKAQAELRKQGFGT